VPSVVQHYVDLEVSRDVEVDQLHDRQHVLGSVALSAVVEDLAGGDVHHRVQVGRSVVNIRRGARSFRDHADSEAKVCSSSRVYSN